MRGALAQTCLRRARDEKELVAVAKGAAMLWAARWIKAKLPERLEASMTAIGAENLERYSKIET